MDTYMAFALLSGLFWTATYALIIYRGFKDKAHGMPMYALALNFSWEFIYSFVTPSPGIQWYINIAWCLFDVVIVYHFLRCWKVDYPDLKPRAFYPYAALVFVTAFLLVLFMQLDGMNPALYDQRGHALGMGRAYSAYGMNLIMAVLYVEMILKRKSIAGQSIYIALFKLIGTVFASLCFVIAPYPNAAHPGTPAPGELLWPLLYAAIFAFDAIYVALVYNRCKAEGVNPWKRA
ncbi:MAG: hypothetical protein H7A27_04830 [Spirochaetaceae bacterium]|nr:hypothetical protein [Spirochaetaceae bacterium]